MFRYTTFQYYIEIIFSKFCTPAILEHLWRLSFGAKIVRNITWKMAFLTWTKPGDNLECLAKTTGIPVHCMETKWLTCRYVSSYKIVQGHTDCPGKEIMQPSSF